MFKEYLKNNPNYGKDNILSNTHPEKGYVNDFAPYNIKLYDEIFAKSHK